MLINLTNHPSNKWPAEQMEAAIRQFQNVEDLPFPAIDPQWSGDRVAILAQQYKEDILALRRNKGTLSLHLQGEFTFTFHLVNLLKSEGIDCYVSTSHRKVVEQGNKKTVEFNFVRFRKY